MNGNSGLISSLFDLSFSELVTTKIVKFLYIIAIVASAISAFVMVIGGFAASFKGGLFALIMSPIVFFLQLLFARVWLELIIVVFKIAENTSRLVDKNINN